MYLFCNQYLREKEQKSLSIHIPAKIIDTYEMYNSAAVSFVGNLSYRGQILNIVVVDIAKKRLVEII